MSATVASRVSRRTRFARVLVATAVLAGVLVSTAAALRFSDESYMVPQGVAGTPYSHTFSAPPPTTSGAGCDPPYIFRVLQGALPPGLSLGQTSGVVSGTPTQAGAWSFWVQLSDDPSGKESWCTSPMSAEREFTISILPGLAITTTVAAPGTVGATYSAALATDLPGQKAWSVSSGALPAGLTLGAADGVISGTPTTAGSFPFVVKAVLDDKRSDTQDLTIVVRAPVEITTPSPPRSEVGVPFRLPLSASGGAGTYTWSVSGGALPRGLALSADGTIAGTPSLAGTYAFTVSASDTEGRVAPLPATLVVAPRLAIATRLLRPGKVGRLYRARLRTSGGVIPKTWRVKTGPLPRGIRLDRTLGVLSGTPTKPGRYRVTFEAVDALGVKSSKTLVINVRA